MNYCVCWNSWYRIPYLACFSEFVVFSGFTTAVLLTQFIYRIHLLNTLVNNRVEYNQEFPLFKIAQSYFDNTVFQESILGHSLKLAACIWDQSTSICGSSNCNVEMTQLTPPKHVIACMRILRQLFVSITNRNKFHLICGMNCMGSLLFSIE